MRSIHVRVFLILSLFLLQACFPHKIRAGRELYTEKATTVSLSAQPRHQLNVLYTGCGGLVINSDSFSVLVDPFYSNKGLPMFWKRLATDKRQADKVGRIIDSECGGTRQISTVLVAHAHYDHVLDLPYMLATCLKDSRPRIFGNASTRDALANIELPPYRFTVPEVSPVKPFATFPLNEEMTLTVIHSGHAPHARISGQDFRMMGGDTGPKGVRGFNTRAYKAWFWKWREGRNYAFMLNLHKKGMRRPLRVFIQSSSCDPPDGIPGFLQPGDSVDIAFLGVASANYLKDYPTTLLRTIRPRYVVLIHWEDFFRAYHKRPKVVRATKMHVFLDRYKKAMGPRYASVTSMPRQLVNYKFLY